MPDTSSIFCNSRTLGQTRKYHLQTTNGLCYVPQNLRTHWQSFQSLIFSWNILSTFSQFLSHYLPHPPMLVMIEVCFCS